MGYRSIGQHWSGRTGSEDENRVRTYVKVWQVFTDDPNLDETYAANAPGVPILGDLHPLDLLARVTKVRAEQQQDEPTAWFVVVEYSTASREKEAGAGSGRDPAQDKDEPTQRPPEVSVSFEAVKRPLWQDIRGDAILTSAGDPYDPPYEAVDMDMVVKVSWNKDLFDKTTVAFYQDAINSDTFLDYAPGKCKIRKYDGQMGFENEEWHWKMSLEIQCTQRDWGFKARLLDCGYQELDVEGDFKRVALDVHGQPYSSPPLLDGNGRVIRASSPSQAPVFFDYDVCPSRRFTGKHIDDTLDIETIISNAFSLIP